MLASPLGSIFRRPMKDAYRRLLIVTIVFLSGFLVVAGLRKLTGNPGLLEFLKNTDVRSNNAPEKATLAADAPIAVSEIPLLQRLDLESTKLTEAVMPSVVSIDTAGVQGRQVIDQFGRPTVQTSRVMGQGSGVIASYEGHVITNYHVIANKQKILVTTAENKTYPADLIGTDPALDIAVIKVRGAKRMRPLKFGDSDLVREGNRVLAFGNPFNIGKSVTDGVISARERSLSDRQGGLLQSSAAINPGYSGGPLVNMRGEVIGINSSIYSTDEKNPGFQGISFSIPSNIVTRTFEDIRKRGRPIRGFLGVSMSELDGDLRRKLGLRQDYGALVQRVGEGTPAARAGIEPEDVILKWDGRKVRDYSHLIGLIQRSDIGAKVPVEIWRDHRTVNLEVTVSELDSNLAGALEPADQVENPLEILRAVGVETMYLGVSEWRQGHNGVKVRNVLKGSLADGLIKNGDIIFQVDQQAVHQPDQFYRYVLTHALDNEMVLHVLREGEPYAMKVVLPPLSER